MTSNGEYMDIEVHSIVSCENLMDKLNHASVPGIEVISVKILPEHTPNAMASVAAASYTVRFREGRAPQAELVGLLPSFLSREQILITKKTKKGSRELDLKKGIFHLEIPSPGVLSMLVDASSGGNIKPIHVVEAILAQNGETLQENALLITREDVYTNLGSEDHPRFISLGEIGSDM